MAQHSFDIEIATELSIDEAILIHHFQFWISHNKRKGKNLIDGRTWLFQTTLDLIAHFPYYKNIDKIKKILKKLLEKNIIIKGNFNKNKWDHTQWYSFTDENLYLNGVKYNKDLFTNSQREYIERNPLDNQQVEDNNLDDSQNKFAFVLNSTIVCAEQHNHLGYSAQSIKDNKRRYIKKEEEAVCVREADTVQALPFSASPLFSLFSDLLPKWDSQLKPITAWQDELHDICTKKNIDSNELIDILRWIDQSKDKFWTIKIKNPSSLLRNFEEIVKQYTNRKISKSSIVNDEEKERSDIKHEFFDFLKSEREFYNASTILFKDKGVEINNIFYDYLALNVKKIIANIIEIWKRSEKA